MRTIFGLLILLLSGCAHSPVQHLGSDEARIRNVIERFNAALQSRNKAAYLDLFLQDNVSWQSVMDDFQLSRERRKNPRATRAQIDPKNTHLSFIDRIVDDPKVGAGSSQSLFPIKVDTDGDVASASQDYRYFYDGREAGRGRSIWLLVRTEDGWKINAVAYSKKGPQRQ